MVASENDGIRNCKVGGIGDVVRDAPRALAEKGHEIVVVTPSYGFLHLNASMKKWASPFLHLSAPIEIYEIPGKQPNPRIRHFVVQHPTVVSRDGKIFFNDSNNRPFATDASKFAHFCRAVGLGIQSEVFGKLDCLHLHDWHAAFMLVLRRFHHGFHFLQTIPTAYTIHNLALQGVRPLVGDESSLQSWYPDLSFDWNHWDSNQDVREILADPNPKFSHCVNPMAVGIRLADAVHTVSPSYAVEILEPSDKPKGHYGGEGLEIVLRHAQGKLFGILNGCEYPENRSVPKLGRKELFSLLRLQAASWLSPHLVAFHRLTDPMPVRKEAKILLTSVTRVVDQKLLLMMEKNLQGKSGLEALLDCLGNRGVYVLLGTGTPDYESFLRSVSVRYDNFIFLNGYSDEIAQALYANGDVFLMPSSFEPCGISQMLAMRDGQPCVVHSVGGLKDTVQDGVNGFAFSGANLTEKVENFVSTCMHAIEMKLNRQAEWKMVQQNAQAARFLWAETAEQYLSKLYRR